MNSAQNGSHTQGWLRLWPNDPGYPRAIVHATWNPVHASVTLRVESST